MAYVQETHRLPSNGVLGGPKELTIRNITTKEEKLLLGSTNDALDKVLEKCIVQNHGPVDLDNLISADKHFLIFKLRILSYGPYYYVKYRCPFCRKESEYKINLDECSTDYLPEDFEEPYEEIVLPQSKLKFGLKIPRAKDVDAIDRKARRYMKKFPEAEGDISYIYGLMSNIMTMDGKPIEKDRDLQEKIESLSGMDSSFLKETINKIKVGLDTTVEEVCPKCKEDIEFTIPINQDFFRARFNNA